jgi:hypothetical protein
VDAPYPGGGGGGEVLGHMSNGYNSLTFLFCFSYFYGFQYCSKEMVNTNVYTRKIKNVRCSASCGGGEGGKEHVKNKAEQFYR